MKTLAEKAAAYQRGGQHMVEALRGIQSILEDILPERFKFTHRSVTYTSNYMSSNIGEWGPALCYTGRCTDYMAPIPETWQEAGSGGYLHSDLHKPYEYATRGEIKKVASLMLDFLMELEKHLDTLTIEMGEHTHTLHKMLEAVGQKPMKKSDRESTRSVENERGMFLCGCGWEGKGSGPNGRIIEGDRCPGCGELL